MTTQADFYSAQYSDGLLTVQLGTPTTVTGWTCRYREFVNPGGGQPLVFASGQNSGQHNENLIEKWIGSGTTGGQSGITMVNNQGTWQMQFYPSEISGRVGAYPYVYDRMDSGYQTRLAEGWHLIT